MMQHAKGEQYKPGPIHLSPAQDVNELKQEAEVKKVTGRHKNSGQEDHKCAR